MEIAEIKVRLSITDVLAHYGLAMDRSKRVRCPFHDDRTPSLQIYPGTNTWCCFSSDCNAGTGDTIQFIELFEKCTKQEAIKKAQSLAGESLQPAAIEASSVKENEGALLAREALLLKVFGYYKKALTRSEKAVNYLKGRSLNYHVLEVGYNSGGLHVESKNHHLVTSMVQYGLLKPLPAQGYATWGRDCVIFPLKNQDNKISSLYGRSITSDENNRHFYLQGRSGLYPGYPSLQTKKLILTESVIDAASLLQQAAITDQYTILALYGTNGLTEEHTAAIIALPQLEEIILLLDADEAGEAAVAKHAGTLKSLLPSVTITSVRLPDGEDVNSVLQSHEDASVLVHLIEERKEFSFSIEKENKPSLTTLTTPALQPTQLNTFNPELLRYDNCELHIEVLGGIRITGLDRMKVTLKVRHKEKVNQPQWHSLDLYHQGQREQTITSVAETLEVSTQQTTQTFTQLTTELEQYRLARIQALQPQVQEKSELTAAQKQVGIAELKKPKLLQRTGQMLHECGIVGEENNSLIAYLIYTTRKQEVPLHVMFLGSSGSGKTYLQEKISELIPAEDKIEITQITENALYYFKQQELAHKLLLIEDLDGASGVLYPLRELQTKRRISKTVTLKDTKGNLKTITLTVEGPVSVSGCTTREKLYEDNANRCILLYTDQGKEQDKRINQYQTKLAAGEINREREQQYRELFKNMQGMLRPIKIINPYAKYIELPSQVFKPRRTMTLLLGFIEAITFYHQYQREIKKDPTGQLYIETTIPDIEAAFALLQDILFSKSDELARATRNFFEQLKTLCRQTSTDTFTARTVRERLRISPGNMKRYLAELVRYGYVKASGNRYRQGSYEYSIVNLSEYEALQSSIVQHVQSILHEIRSHPAPQGQ